MTSLFSILRPTQLSDLKPLPFFMVKMLVPQIRYYMKNWLSSGFGAPFEALETGKFDDFTKLLFNFESAYMSETGVDMISWVSKSLGTAFFAMYLDKKLIQYYSEDFKIKKTPEYKANIFTVASRSKLLDGDNTFQSHITWDIVNLASALNHVVSVPTQLFQAERSMRLVQEAISDTKSLSSVDSTYFVLGLAGITLISTVSGIAIKKWCTDLCKAEYDNKKGVLDVAKSIEQNIDTIESTGALEDNVSFIADSQWNAVKFRMQHDVVDYSGDFLQAAVSSAVFLLSFYFLKEAILGNNDLLDRGEVTLLINKIFSEANTMIKIGSALNKAYIGLVYAKDSWIKLSDFIERAEKAKAAVIDNALDIKHIEDADSTVALEIKGFEMVWSSLVVKDGQNTIAKYLNTTQIDDATFEYGKKYYLQGETGAGKTTLIHHILYGYSHAESMKGKVQISQKVKHLITLPNHGNKKLAEILDDFTSETAQKYIEALKLADVFKQDLARPWNTFSAGEQKRIVLLNALLEIEENSLLVLDESFNSIDKEVKKDVEAFVSQVAQDKNLCLIIVDHNTESKKNIVHVKKDSKEQLFTNVMRDFVIKQMRNNQTVNNIICDDEDASKYIELLELNDLKASGKRWSKLNDNEQKRIVLLHALLEIKKNPRDCALDEPLRYLDYKMQQSVVAVLNGIMKEEKISIAVLGRKDSDKAQVEEARKRIEDLTKKSKDSKCTPRQVIGSCDYKLANPYIKALQLQDVLSNKEKCWNDITGIERNRIALLIALLKADNSKHGVIIEVFADENCLPLLRAVCHKEEGLSIKIYAGCKDMHAHPEKSFLQSILSGGKSSHSEKPACCSGNEHGH